MSKNDVANGNLGAANNMQENSINNDTKEFKSNLNNEQQQPSKPQNVRQIPIYVEGRSEPLMNKVDTTSAAFGGTGRTLGGGVHNVTSQHTEIPRPATSSSIFSRVKDIPVKVIPGFDSSSRRSASPASAAAAASAGVARNIPIQVQHSTSNRKLPNLPQDHDNVRKSPSPCPQLPQDPITKIQNIQGEVINLMGKVEAFNGTKKSKEYVYLDEMLTQTLLKLDTIDTDGKENIKAARKEVINCINKCITALESKATESESNANPNYDSASTESANKETDSSGAKCDQNKT